MTNFKKHLAEEFHDWHIKFIKALNDAIAEKSSPYVDENHVNVTDFCEAFVGRDICWPLPQTLRLMLLQDGYEKVGWVDLYEKGNRKVVWSKVPHLFRKEGTRSIDKRKTQAYLMKKIDAHRPVWAKRDADIRLEQLKNRMKEIEDEL